MAIYGKKCGICRRLSSMENTMGKFGICLECHGENATYQGYTARSSFGPGTPKDLRIDLWYIFFSEYWTDFLTGWFNCAISYRMGPFGHIPIERTAIFQDIIQKNYNVKYGYDREMQYLPEKPVPKQFRASRI